MISADFMAKKWTREKLAKVLKPVGNVPLVMLPSDKPWRDKVHAFLKQNEMTQQDLADWVEMSQGSLSDVISDSNVRFKPRHEYVGKIGEAVGIGLPDQARIELAVIRLQEAGYPEQVESTAFNLEAIIEKIERGKR